MKNQLPAEAENEADGSSKSEVTVEAMGWKTKVTDCGTDTKLR